MAPVRAKKRLGQHFLINRGILAKIVEAAELQAEDTVVEVGPGTGVLTRELAAHAGQVIAVELDRDLVERLRSELPNNVRVLYGDILQLPPERLFPEPPSSYKVVANLPYYITAPVLRHFLAGSFRPERLVVMVQYEVAQTITARPGDMSLLSVAVQFYGRAEFVAAVSPGSFQPPPKVRSAIVRIDTYDDPPVDVPSAATFFDTVRAGFSARRKQLRNALAQGWKVPTEDAARILLASAVDPARRAQTLSLEEWAAVTRARYAS